jgi:signal peptidase II
MDIHMKHLKISIYVFILLLLDLTTKYFFYPHTAFNSPYITPTLNTGIARSLPVPLRIVGIITLAVIGGIYYIYSKKQTGWLAVSFFLAGSLGNLIDRLVLGGVRDFINIGIFNFPIFNLADIFLNVGIVLLLRQTFILEKKK